MLTGSLVSRRYFEETLNLHRSREDSWKGRGFSNLYLLEPDMPNDARISISASKISSQRSDSHPLVTIALFSGVGLLASLTAILCGVQVAWF